MPDDLKVLDVETLQVQSGFLSSPVIYAITDQGYTLSYDDYTDNTVNSYNSVSRIWEKTDMGWACG